MCEKCENTIAETFVKGLNAIHSDDKLRFSSKSKEIKEMVREGLS
ncbi:MAG: hypothetical protein QE164_01840 [Candidatus Nezhaarchaeota archaeon]|nr:hypothetical protein [Candidatus Nezhaarchaeota archaeon]